MIVDAHTHAFPPAVIARRESLLAEEPAFAEIYGDASAKMATADDVLESMDRAGVDHSVICNFAWSQEALVDETNDYILRAAADSAGRLLPFVSVSLAGAGKHGGPDVEEAVGERKRDARTRIRTLSSQGARGIGELRPESSGYDLANSDEADLLAWAASAFDLPLLVHASEPVGHHYPGKRGLTLESLYEFARSASGVTIIAAHLGGGMPFYALMPEVRDAMANMYVDTAAGHLLYDPRVYGTVAGIIGADRMLFGSDFPLTSQEKALERLRAANLDDATLAAITGANTASLFGL